jgi:preprotein translocase subunit SecE
MGVIYKPGQGRYARISTGVLLGLFVGYGCNSLRYLLGGTSLSAVLARVIPVAVFLVAAAGIAFALNYPKFADFLIETEIEMGRVIWPTRKAVLGSSVVVIVTVLVMAALLFGADELLLWLLRRLRLY